MNVLFIDSGLGGISTLCCVIKELPKLNFIYYADNQYAPYGKLKNTFITTRLTEIINSQINNNIGLIVIACNTATACSIDYLRQRYNVPIVGIEPAIMTLTKTQKALVLATKATTKQQRFKKLIKNCMCKVKVLPKKHLASQIEQALLYPTNKHTSQLNKSIKSICKASKDCTHIVLGCTHYSFIKDKLSHISPLTILDGNYGVAKQVCRLVDNTFLSSKPLQKFVFSKQNSDLCKKYRKIFKQTLANV